MRLHCSSWPGGHREDTVITRRIAWLIAQRRAAEEILALTFTTGARDGRARRSTRAYGYADVEIATFTPSGQPAARHSLEIGLKNDFSVLSGGAGHLLRDRLFELRWRYRPLAIRRATCRRSSRSSAAARTRTSPRDYAVREDLRARRWCCG